MQWLPLHCWAVFFSGWVFLTFQLYMFHFLTVLSFSSYKTTFGGSSLSQHTLSDSINNNACHLLSLIMCPTYHHRQHCHRRQVLLHRHYYHCCPACKVLHEPHRLHLIQAMVHLWCYTDQLHYWHCGIAKVTVDFRCLGFHQSHYSARGNRESIYQPNKEPEVSLQKGGPPISRKSCWEVSACLVATQISGKSFCPSACQSSSKNALYDKAVSTSP